MYKKANPTADDVSRSAGGNIVGGLLGGLGIGAGGMGLWYLAKRLKKKQQEAMANYPDFGGEPVTPAAIALAPALQLDHKQAFDYSSLALPVGGALLGAGAGAMASRDGKKLRGALLGAGLGGTAGGLGLAINSDAAKKVIGEHIPKHIPLFSGLFGSGDAPGGKPSLTRPTGTYIAAENLGTIGAGGLGVLAGGAAVDSILRRDESEKNKDRVQGARDEYFKTLLGDENEDEKEDKEKTAFSKNLDAIYEKASAAQGDYLGRAGEYLSSFLHGNPEKGPYDSNSLVNAWRSLSGAGQTMAGLTALGTGALGAKYMYDKTRENSKAKLLNAARQARLRLAGFDSPWVDPVELAQVKERVAKNELSHAQGM